MPVSEAGSKLLNRRRYPRIIKSLPIHYKLSSGNMSQSYAKKYAAQTHDIGIGGISLDAVIEDKMVAKELLAKKSKLDITIDLMNNDKDLYTKANIVWIYNAKGLPSKTKYGLGLKFSNLSKAEKDIFSSYINKLISIRQNQSIKNRQKIKQTLARIARVTEDSFSEDTLIREELGVDSLMAMEALAAIETIYDIEIDESRAFDVITVNDLMNLIEEYLEKKEDQELLLQSSRNNRLENKSL